MHENITTEAERRRGLRFISCTVTCPSSFWFSFFSSARGSLSLSLSLFVHTGKRNLFNDLVWFIDLDAWKEHVSRAVKPREMAHCDVVYPSPNTECNTVNVVKTFFLNGYYYYDYDYYDYYYYDDYYKAILAS